MSDAYRDDLAAARARVSDLEREAERLRARNAELTAKNRELEPPVKAEPVAPDPEPPSAFVRTMMVLTKVGLFTGVFAVTGGSKYPHHHHPSTYHPIVALVCFTLAFVFWACSGFRRSWK